MSVIVWDGKFLATDSVEFVAGRMKYRQKIVSTCDGVMAFCGLVSSALRYCRDKSECAATDTDYFFGVEVTSEGVRFVESGVAHPYLENQSTPLVYGQEVAVGMVHAYMSMSISGPTAIQRAINTKVCDSIFGPVQIWLPEESNGYIEWATTKDGLAILRDTMNDLTIP